MASKCKKRSSRGAETVKKYKYLIKYSLGERHLNELGKEGWELVSVDYEGNEFIFKKEIENHEN